MAILYDSAIPWKGVYDNLVCGLVIKIANILILNFQVSIINSVKCQNNKNKPFQPFNYVQNQM